MAFLNYDRYKRRLKLKGEHTGDVYDSNTIAFIEKNFSNSPSYRLLEVNSFAHPDIKTYDARVIDVDRIGNLKEILFRPKQGLKIGTTVKFDGDWWIIYDAWGTIESTYAKSLAQKCNTTIKWKDIGENVKEVNCIASAQPIGSKANQGKQDIYYNKYDVMLATGQLFVYVELNENTKTLYMNQRFIFGNSVYEIYGIDDSTTVEMNGHGMLQLLVKLSTKQDADDFTNRIANNKKNDTGTGGGGGSPW